MIKPQIINAIPTIENFLRHCQRQVHKSKSVIVREGEQSNSLFIILEGSVSVMVEDDDKDHKMVVSYLNLGDFLGENCRLLQGDGRTSTEVPRREKPGCRCR